MNTEQERAAFEAWLRIKPCGAAPPPPPTPWADIVRALVVIVVALLTALALEVAL